MQELDDISLLREYVDHGSEDAFAALVARHVNKVYSIALRRTHNPHHDLREAAEDRAKRIVREELQRTECTHEDCDCYEKSILLRFAWPRGCGRKQS